MRPKPRVPVIMINEYDVKYALEDFDFPKISKADLEEIADQVRVNLAEIEPFWEVFGEVLTHVVKNYYKIKEN